MTKHSEIFPAVMPGVVIAWSSNINTPDNMMFIECNGTSLSLSIDRYQPLFNVIGFDYGGDGESYFMVPDYRGRFLRHKSSTQGVGVVEADGLQSHTHSVSYRPPHANTVTNNTAWAVNLISRYYYPTEIGRSSGTYGTSVSTEVLPKTMHVKYYIGY